MGLAVAPVSCKGGVDLLSSCKSSSTISKFGSDRWWSSFENLHTFVLIAIHAQQRTACPSLTCEYDWHRGFGGARGCRDVVLTPLLTVGAAAPKMTDAASDAIFVGAFEGDVQTFKGIRYATIAARFAVVELASYRQGEQYDATTFGPRCFQVDDHPDPTVPSVSEDCLFLNIWRPVGTASECSLPVALWIHGGGFTSGSGSDWMYNGTLFSKNEGVIYVSINYRLGPLGYLCVDDVCTGGMNNMMDQIVALKWVQTHIASFGGNPSVFGESAGGGSICSLVVSDKAAGLFQRAVIESGPCIGSFAPPMPV